MIISVHDLAILHFFKSTFTFCLATVTKMIMIMAELDMTWVRYSNTEAMWDEFSTRIVWSKNKELTHSQKWSTAIVFHCHEVQKSEALKQSSSTVPCFCWPLQHSSTTPPVDLSLLEDDICHELPTTGAARGSCDRRTDEVCHEIVVNP